MANIDISEIYKSDFIDSRSITWEIDMWSCRGLTDNILSISSYAISSPVVLEFKDLTDLILLINSIDYFPQDLRKFCIKVYKNRVFS